MLRMSHGPQQSAKHTDTVKMTTDLEDSVVIRMNIITAEHDQGRRSNQDVIPLFHDLIKCKFKK